MTQAQKTAKAKFKQAIAYRTKTGVSLKEAFAHIYGKKKAAKKVVRKKAAKKVVRKKAAKKRISGSQDYYTRKKEGHVIPRKTKRKKATKKKPTERAVLKSIQNAVKVQKLHMGAIGSAAIDRIKTNMSHLSHYDHAHKKYMSMPLRERKKHTAAIKKLKHLIKETKTHITQLKRSI